MTLKIPPHSAEGENGILASLLLEPNAGMDICIEKELSGEDFYDIRNSLLYSEIARMHESGKMMDALTIVDGLKSSGSMERIGGFDRLTEIQQDMVSVENIGHYVEIVRTKRAFRTIIEKGSLAVERAYSEDEDPSSLASDLVGAIEDVGVLDNIEGRTTEQLCKDALELDEKVANGDRLGLPFPWVNFQSRTFGIPSKAVTPIGGRDGMGKSRLATSLSEFWVKQGIPILYFPFEDGSERFISNVAASHGGYDMFTIKRDFVPPDFMRKHKETMARVAKFPLYVEDYPDTAERLVAIIARYKRKHGIEGVVIDGFKDMIPTTGENQTAKENHMNAHLVRAAKRYDVSIVPISHINKVEDDRWIKKTDITGAGNQFKSARMVLLYQDYLPESLRAEYGAHGDEIVLEASKTSYGNKGIVVLKPELENGRFVEVRKGHA